MSEGHFTFQPLTIGQMLKRGQLKVPPNQRSYAWREKQVRYLLQDFSDAIFDQESDDYFLGTVVIVDGSDVPYIVDGQQRLVTTSILLARVRDILLELGRDKSAQSIEQTYLENIDIRTEESVPRIQMNEDNNDFYNSSILPQDFSGKISIIKKEKLKQTNTRMLNASVLVDTFLRNSLDQVASEKKVDSILKWEYFINNKARILSVFVSDEFAAYRMFETLNDRGLRASQVDILKNYLFSRCDTRLEEAKMLWREIDTIIESLGSRNVNDEDEGQDDSDKSGDPLILFFKHFWVVRDSPTKAKDLAEKIRTNLTNESRVMRFLSDAVKATRDYVAIARSDDQKWRQYPATARQDIETINNNLRVSQIKPLVLAIAHCLEPQEAGKALQLCVSWSVRFLLVGGRGGMLDTQYSRRASEIGTGKITKARELREAMKAYVPSNEEFEQAFAVAKISRPWFARYLIRAIEKKRKNLPCPEYIENEDVRDINLEHILPIRPSKEWSVDPDVAEASYNLLGNMVLLSSAKNTGVGNLGFPTKKKAFSESGYLTTSDVAKYEQWGRDQILDRQKSLASFAISTWPLEFKG